MESKLTNGKGKGKVPEVVIIDDSDSEEEQKSKTSNPTASVLPTRNPSSVPSNPSPAPPPAVGAPNLLNTQTAPTTSASPLLFDRLAMERERLERQKRLRGDLNAPASSSEEEVESQDAGDERETKRRRLNGNTDAAISASTPIAVQRDVPAVSRPVARPTNELFLDGEVRPTWNAYAEGDTRKRFKIQDIMGDVSPIIYI